MWFPPTLNKVFLQLPSLKRGESCAGGRSTMGKGVYMKVGAPGQVGKG